MQRTGTFLQLLLVCLAAQGQKITPLDTARPTMQALKARLEKRFEYYRAKYPDDTLVMKNLTTYEYGSDGKLLFEKGYSADMCHLYAYRNEQMVEKLTDYNGSLDLELNNYDEKGTLTARRQYNDDFPGNIHEELFSYEQKQHHSKDSVTIISMVNGHPVRRTVYIHRQTKLIKTLNYSPVDDSIPDSEFIFDEQSKRINRNVSHMTKLDYHQETIIRYNDYGQTESYLTKDLNSGKVKETISYYSHKLKTTSEDLVSGQLEFRRYYAYDAKGNLIRETGREPDGRPRYACLYEYDRENRKVCYLYFFRY